MTTFVIVGAGLAGAKAAETLREEGFDGRVLLVGAESELPYERPPLSKGYLMGAEPRDGAQVHPAAFYAEHDIELLTGLAAAGLDVPEHRVRLADGQELTYDRLLIATGAVPRRPPIEGIDLPHVRTLRTLGDADALREAFGSGGTVAVIGGGWIGCEVAAAARTLGRDVVLIERAQTPLARVLGPELGTLFADLQRSEGVELHSGAAVERISADRVQLAGGDAVECATVVVGVGVMPDTRLAEAAGLRVEDGIVVDELLRTSAPDVFAAGDVANAFHPRFGRHVRVEHWGNALHQGPAAARSMLDRGDPYVRLPYFFSDQFSLGMEYVGLHSADDRVVVRRPGEELRLQAFWVDDRDRITAGMHINDWDTIETIEGMIGTEAGQPSGSSSSSVSST